MKCKGEDMCRCDGTCKASCNADAKQKETQTRHGVVILGQLPDWWDARGKLATYGGALIITHPEHPAMKMNPQTLEWEEIRLDA